MLSVSNEGVYMSSPTFAPVNVEYLYNAIPTPVCQILSKQMRHPNAVLKLKVEIRMNKCYPKRNAHPGGGYVLVSALGRDSTSF